MMTRIYIAVLMCFALTTAHTQAVVSAPTLESLMGVQISHYVDYLVTYGEYLVEFRRQVKLLEEEVRAAVDYIPGEIAKIKGLLDEHRRLHQETKNAATAYKEVLDELDADKYKWENIATDTSLVDSRKKQMQAAQRTLNEKEGALRASQESMSLQIAAAETAARRLSTKQSTVAQLQGVHRTNILIARQLEVISGLLQQAVDQSDLEDRERVQAALERRQRYFESIQKLNTREASVEPGTEKFFDTDSDRSTWESSNKQAWE